MHVIVDSHTHAGTSWFEPVETLIHQMDANGVQKAVLIQHGGMYDNAYLSGLRRSSQRAVLRRRDGRRGVILRA